MALQGMMPTVSCTNQSPACYSSLRREQAGIFGVYLWIY